MQGALFLRGYAGTAQWQLHVIFHGGCCRVNGLAQRVKSAGQRAGGVDGAGIGLKKGAVACAGIGAQHHGRQKGLRGKLLLAKSIRRQARGQAQATGNAVQVITGKHQVPPVTAAVPAACTDKVKWLPCRQPRALGQRSGRFGTARFCHRRTSSGVCSPSAMARTALKALSTMLATFTSV